MATSILSRLGLGLLVASVGAQEAVSLDSPMQIVLSDEEPQFSFDRVEM